MFGLRLIFSRYPQTWSFWAYLSKALGGEAFYRWGQRACGRLTGHHPSRTEWGYAGGGTYDCWCRWCNHMGQMPLSHLDRKHPKARNVIWGFTGCDIRHREWTGPDGHDDNQKPNVPMS